MIKDTIKIAEEFSRYPAGRFDTDGPYSGEKFRREFLVPAMQEKKKICIDLDGVRGYGSSFLEEAFGGLVRVGFSAEDIFSLMTFHSSDPSLVIEIRDYIEHA